jgi:predicted ester cyclase
MSIRKNKAVVRRWYDDMWNPWDFAVIEEIAAPDLQFRGSLGIAVLGRDGLKRYMQQVRAIFPGFHNQVDVLVAEHDLVAARLTYTGTHKGEVLEIAPTGKRIQNAGAAFFRLANH